MPVSIPISVSVPAPVDDNFFTPRTVLALIWMLYSNIVDCGQWWDTCHPAPSPMLPYILYSTYIAHLVSSAITHNHLCSSWIVERVWVQYMSHNHSIFKLVHEPVSHQLNICAMSNSTFLISRQAWRLTKAVIPPTWCVGVLTSLSPTPDQKKNERKAWHHMCKSKGHYLCLSDCEASNKLV